MMILTQRQVGDSSTPVKRRLRVGLISNHHPEDKDAMSGTLHSVFSSLESEGVELVYLGARKPPRKEFPIKARLRGLPGYSQARRVKWHARSMLSNRTFQGGSHRVYERSIQKAKRMSNVVQANVDAAQVDLLFGVFISTMLYQLETSLPIVYSSDTTAKLINGTYPKFVNRPSGYHRACDEIERAALNKCRLFVASSQRTARSAIEDYGMEPSRVIVAPYGAHVVPERPWSVLDAPHRSHLELSLVAADPIRKRLGLCIETAEILKRRGWNVRLNYIGPPTPEAERSPLVQCYGRLRLADENDRQIHRDVLARSHWMLLPSVAEAYGIAPCEAAHFGRPSVVSDEGGLPTVVQHGRTGIVLPVAAPAQAYADALETYSATPTRYRALAEKALHRAQTVLNWEVWAKRMRMVFEELVQEVRHAPR